MPTKLTRKYAVHSAVREAAGEGGFRVGAEFLEQLDAKLDQDVRAAMGRAKANGRQTLKAQDL